MEASDDYLFRGYDREEVRGWARKLKYFRFCRGSGGHANEPDQLLAAFVAPTRTAADTVLTKLGAPAQGGNCELFGVRAYVQYNAYTAEVSISIGGRGKDPYAVSAADFEAAGALEPHLAALATELKDPPIDTALCLSPSTTRSFGPSPTPT